MKLSIKDVIIWILSVVAIFLSPRLLSPFQDLSFYNAIKANPWQTLLIFSKVWITITIPFILYFYSNKLNGYIVNKKASLLSSTLATLFSLFLTLGYSYDTINSSALCFHNYIYIIIFIVQNTVYINILYKLIIIIIVYIGNIKVSTSNIYNKFSYKVLFFFLILSRLIYLVLLFPCILDGDSSACINSFINDKPLTNHHPLIYHFIYGYTMKLGLYINNPYLTFFLLSLIHIFILSLIIIYAIKILDKIYGKNRITELMVIFYIFFPVFSIWNIYLAKDTIFSMAIFIWVLSLFNLIQSKFIILKNNSYLFIHSIILLIVCLTKNQGIYLVIIEMFILLFISLKNWRRIIVPYIGTYIIYSLIYLNVFLPKFNITQSGNQEKFGFMFQQTARYIKEYPNDLTNKEKDIINKILPVDTIAKLYNPILQDPVKFQYRYMNRDVNEKIALLDAYKEVWLKMFLKHPWTYIEATINTCYQNFYFELKGSSTIAYTKSSFANIPNDSPMVIKQNNNISNLFYIAIRVLAKVPILGLLFSIPFYIWISIFFLFFFIIYKDFNSLAIYFPIFTSILVLIVAPCVSMRYVMPIIWVIPFIITSTILKLRKDE